MSLETKIDMLMSEYQLKDVVFIYKKDDKKIQVISKNLFIAYPLIKEAFNIIKTGYKRGMNKLIGDIDTLDLKDKKTF